MIMFAGSHILGLLALDRVRLNLPSLTPLSRQGLLHRAELAAPVEVATPAP